MNHMKQQRPRLAEDSDGEYNLRRSKRNSVGESSIHSQNNTLAESSSSRSRSEPLNMVSSVQANSDIRENDSVLNMAKTRRLSVESGKAYQSLHGSYPKSSVDMNAPSTNSMKMKDLSNHLDGKSVEKKTRTEVLPDDSMTIVVLKKAKKRLTEQARELRNENKEYKATIEALEEDIELLQNDRGEREARFQEAQEDALKLLKRDAIDALPDDRVQEELKIIFDRCRRWTKKHAGTLPVDREGIKESIRVMLHGKNDRKSASTEGLHAALDGVINIRHVITAMLTRHLIFNFFHRPFFYLQNCKQGGLQKSTEKQLLHVQKMGTNSGEKMQHQWRAMTTRMISANTGDITEQGTSTAPTLIQSLKNDAYATFADQVVTTCKALLRDIDDEEATVRRAELRGLFERAGNLACHLHGQHVKIQVLLSPQEIGNFHVNSKIMEAHTTMDIEEDDHSWDGKPIDLVMHPGLLAYGNECGENYDQFKVWSKAVVWMHKQQVKSRAMGRISDKAKPLGGPPIERIASDPRTAVLIIDDDNGQVTKHISEGSGELAEGRGKRRQPMGDDHTKQQSTSTSGQFEKQKHTGTLPGPQSSSKTGTTQPKHQPFISENEESSKTKSGSNTPRKQAKPSDTDLKPQNKKPAKEATGKDTKTSIEKGVSSGKRSWSNDEYSPGVETRPKKRAC
ncbi:hypothetical protein EPUS_02147 [Endocarpon pusillum Z07020]|uniref:Uncharacterized protein n=1 Tax=Endocarpon pusillum (strain Z07020 / HMAS-L-300199) TaxID=1263415 RepID=U1HPE5_ENDPU|nr:uncharacterized protein EPUS_02147 [Endocarpon pusillum Z07020]ERF72260.1 hypothetical protein EPUS_02147 [Endocarpon pusillum Z07020]